MRKLLILLAAMLVAAFALAPASAYAKNGPKPDYFIDEEEFIADEEFGITGEALTPLG